MVKRTDHMKMEMTDKGIKIVEQPSKPVQDDRAFLDELAARDDLHGEVTEAEFLRLYQIARGRAYRCRNRENFDTYGNTDFQLFRLGMEVQTRRARRVMQESQDG